MGGEGKGSWMEDQAPAHWRKPPTIDSVHSITAGVRNVRPAHEESKRLEHTRGGSEVS